VTTTDVMLTRTIRCCLPLDGEAMWLDQSRLNTFAGWPTMAGLGVYAELDVTVRGEPDPTTGYLIGIQDIDAMAREKALPVLAAAIQRRPTPALTDTLHAMTTMCREGLDIDVVRVGWRLTPTFRLEMEAEAMHAVMFRQQFEFAAAHRLHCEALSDADNDRIFGKCNNANGHGHNYRLEVCVTAPIADPPTFGLAVLELIVKDEVIDRFDHTNLGLDVEEFADLNPSVEHIARVCHERLVGPLRAAGGELREVTVWETEKTACTYPAE